MDIQRIETDARRSRVVSYGGLVFVSGQVADDRTQDIDGQFIEVLAKVERFLAAASSDKTRLLAVQIYLQDLDRDYARMNAIWDAWVPAGCAPARITMEVKLAAANILVEVTATAAAV